MLASACAVPSVLGLRRSLASLPLACLPAASVSAGFASACLPSCARRSPGRRSRLVHAAFLRSPCLCPLALSRLSACCLSAPARSPGRCLLGLPHLLSVVASQLFQLSEHGGGSDRGSAFTLSALSLSLDSALGSALSLAARPSALSGLSVALAVGGCALFSVGLASPRLRSLSVGGCALAWFGSLWVRIFAALARSSSPWLLSACLALPRLAALSACLPSL